MADKFSLIARHDAHLGVVNSYHPCNIAGIPRLTPLGEHRQYYGVKSGRKLYSSMAELRVFGDAAFVTGKFLAVDPGKGVEDPGYYLIVLRKDSHGAWRIYRDIDTPSPDGLSLKPGN